jgi:hypothetical protein
MCRNDPPTLLSGVAASPNGDKTISTIRYSETFHDHPPTKQDSKKKRPGHERLSGFPKRMREGEEKMKLRPHLRGRFADAQRSTKNRQ